MFTWFVAKRLFTQGDGGGQASRLATGIATFGVAVGLVVMLLSIAIATGFKQEIQDKVMGFGAHIKVMNYASFGAEESKPIVIDDSITRLLTDIPNVASVARFCAKPGMLKTDSDFRGIIFQGVGQDYDLSFIRQHLTSGEIPQFSDTVSSGKIIISETIAHEMQVQTGSTIYAYFFEQTVRARKFTVAGIYRTNLTDFDRNFAYTDLHTVHTLLGWDTNQYSGAELRLRDFSKLNETMTDAVTAVNRKQDAYGNYYSTISVRMEYPQVFAWLQLLDMDVALILILMICVSVFTAISGLLIIILERTGFIGIMKALGARNSQMRHLFLNYAILIVMRGIVLGNVLALSLIFLQQCTGLVTIDPDVYYVEAVPVKINWLVVGIIDVSTLVISVLAMIVPSFVVSHISPATSIRYE